MAGIGSLFQATFPGLAKQVSQLGYNLGLGGAGISRPSGTPFNPRLTPSAVYTAESTGVPVTSVSTTGQISGFNSGNAQGGTSGGGGGGGGGASGYYNANNDWVSTGTPSNSSGGGGGGGGGGERNPDLTYVDVPGRGMVKLSDLQREEQRARDDINAGYDSYFKELDNQLGGLGGQRSGLEQQIQGQYQSGLTDLQGQRTLGMQDIAGYRTKAETQQERNLKSLANDIQNQYMAGNVYLGARGAGDSSAANMYSYALNKLGSQQRGDIMTKTADIMQELNSKEIRLNEIFNTESNKLASDRDAKLGEVTRWYNEQLNNLSTAKAQGQMAKGQDLASLSKNMLNYAMQQLSTIQAQYANQQSALQQWAMNNSTYIGQLKQNMASVSNYSVPTIGYNMTGTPTVDSAGNIQARYGGYATDEDRKNRGIFG